ncbi:hypothetical protein BS47DRAFT_1350861 [Hydnum rufescens UP504]|uniref:Uncharacterized protein n=1 Tax=Hydnum rufescens UP504 TaxID=1448309 RepID=A0A9P6DR06_9AGAM|nr:hypothetical protein BS47DRAFT_1350861 [Hydnum rufescens UP504]
MSTWATLSPIKLHNPLTDEQPALLAFNAPASTQESDCSPTEYPPSLPCEDAPHVHTSERLKLWASIMHDTLAESSSSAHLISASPAHKLHHLVTMLCTKLDLSKIHLTQCQATQESYETQLILQNLYCKKILCQLQHKEEKAKPKDNISMKLTLEVSLYHANKPRIFSHTPMKIIRSLQKRSRLERRRLLPQGWLLQHKRQQLLKGSK